MAKQVLIVTIVTNGVSFELAAGGIIMLHFSNAPSIAYGSGNMSITVNVNSLGAKSVALPPGQTGYMNVSGTVLLGYNGSNFRFLSMYEFWQESSSG